MGCLRTNLRWDHFKAVNLSPAKEKVSFIGNEGKEYTGCQSFQLDNFELLRSFYFRNLFYPLKMYLFGWFLRQGLCSPCCRSSFLLPLPSCRVLRMGGSMGHWVLLLSCCWFVWELEFNRLHPPSPIARLFETWSLTSCIPDSCFCKELSQAPECTSENRKIHYIVH